MPRRHSNLFTDIELTLHDDLTLTLVNLARTLGVNRHQVERSVHLAAGVTFRTFKKQKQLERARTLLKAGLLVKEVAAQLGYKSPEAFSRFVKLAAGVSPRSMRL